MKKGISVALILSLCLVATGPQASAQTGRFPCNYGVIFAFLIALSTSFGIIGSNIVAGIDQISFMPSTSFKFLSIGWLMVLCLLLEFERLEALEAQQAEASGDTERLSAARSRLEQVGSLITDHKDCGSDMWLNDTTIAVNQDIPMVAQLPLPMNTCACTLFSYVDGELQPVNGDISASANEMVRLAAQCDPTGGTYSWNFTGADRAGLVGRTNAPRAAFIGETRGSRTVELTYTDPDMNVCKTSAKIVVR